MHTDSVLETVKPSGNRLCAVFRNDLTDATSEWITDQVIVEQGTVPLDSVFQELKPLSANEGHTDIEALLAGKNQPEIKKSVAQKTTTQPAFNLYCVGDAVSSRSLHAALLDAYRIAVTL